MNKDLQASDAALDRGQRYSALENELRSLFARAVFPIPKVGTINQTDIMQRVEMLPVSSTNVSGEVRERQKHVVEVIGDLFDEKELHLVLTGHVTLDSLRHFMLLRYVNTNAPGIFDWRESHR